jgi:hypothetical protein
MALIPPDRERCQCEIRAAHNFMTLGPPPRYERCKNKPVCVITEKEPGPDGERGSMSLCGDCYVTFCLKDDPTRVTLEKIDGHL